MKFHRERAIKEMWDKSEEATEMSHELVEHLEDIRSNYRDGYMDAVERLIQEWEGKIELRVNRDSLNR